MLSQHHPVMATAALTLQSSTVMVTPPSVLSALVLTSKYRPLHREKGMVEVCLVTQHKADWPLTR